MTILGNASSVASVNGIELAYQVFGEGAPVIVLHGAFGSVEMFGPNIELLAAGRQVIGVDLQSHGRSPAANRPMRYERMADDIAVLIEQLRTRTCRDHGLLARRGNVARCAPRFSTRESSRRLVLVSTVFKRQGWYPEMVAGLDAMGPETAAHLKFQPALPDLRANSP